MRLSADLQLHKLEGKQLLASLQDGYYYGAGGEVIPPPLMPQIKEQGWAEGYLGIRSAKEFAIYDLAKHCQMSKILNNHILIEIQIQILLNKNKQYKINRQSLSFKIKILSSYKRTIKIIKK